MANERTVPDGSESDELLALAARRDADALGRLYWRYANLVFQYCYRGTGNRAAAEDLTSTIFLTVVDKIARFQGGSFRSWLFTIARNTLINRYRAEQRLVPLSPDHDTPDPGSTPEAIALAGDDLRTVNQLLATLTGEQRDVVELHLAGLNATEIGEVIGKRPDAVRALQSRALTRMKTYVREHAIEWSAM